MASKNTTERQDLLNMSYINSLPQPLLLQFFGGDAWWPVRDIDVGTGLLRIDVCGLLQVSRIGEVKVFRDESGNDHDPEQFYSDYEQEPT